MNEKKHADIRMTAASNDPARQHKKKNSYIESI